MPPRTDRQRYDEAITYLDNMNNGGTALSQAVDLATGNRKDEFGRRISLHGSGARLIGRDIQHQAVKALNLCELAFFSFPHAPDKDMRNTPRNEITDAEIIASRNKFLTSLRGTVDEEIREYMLGNVRSHAGLCSAARRVKEPATQIITLWRIKRSDNKIGGGGSIVCYDGVKNWLFAAGLASRRWIINKGVNLNANTTGQTFGAGTVVAPQNWGGIPAGYFWSVERKLGTGAIDSTTCHWGVSLGGGIAAATNNTHTSLGPHGNVTLQFSDRAGDGTPYGVFRFVDICNILNRNFKYGHQGSGNPAAVDTNIQVKQYDPMTSQALF